MFLGGGDNIYVPADIDAKRVKACKYKKVQGVYAMMKALNAQSCSRHVNIYNGGYSLTNQINASSWTRGQKVLKDKSSYFEQFEEGDTNALSRQNILSNF